jgi:photosystem II stability/assembly factor-like uncharacterized protein
MKPIVRSLSLLAGLALASTLPAAAGWAPLGGPIRPLAALQLVPSRPDLLYARVAVPGNLRESYLWRSEDAGATWRTLQPGLDRRLSALAVDPTNPEVIWAWTANGQLWRSADAGDTWMLRFTATGSSPVIELLVDPRHPDTTLYRVDSNGAAAATRVAVSRDGGASFSPGGTLLPASYYPAEIAVSPLRDELLAFAPNGLQVSTDGGQSWTLRGRYLGTGFTLGHLAPSAPDTLYGLTPKRGSCLARSDDGGAHWQSLTYPPFPPGRSYCDEVAIDPRDARHVWVAGEVAGRRQEPRHLLIAESRDGGATWSATSPVPSTGVVAAGGELLYTGSVLSLGLDVSRDGGKSWTPTDRGIAADDLRDGLVAQRLLRPGSGRRLFALDTPFGASTDGVFRSDGGLDWVLLSLQHPLAIADGGAPALVAIDSRGLVRSPDGNDDFQLVPSAPPQPTALRSDVTQPRDLALLAFEPGSPVGNAAFWISDDGGATWRRSSAGLPIACAHLASVDTCPDFPTYAVDPFNPSRRWVTLIAVYPGQDSVFVSEDAGAAWQLATTALPQALALAADPAVPGRLLSGTYGGLFVSTDGGAHWSPLGDLPANAVVRQLVRDASSGVWYAATTLHGIFRSLDGGAHWTLLEGAPDLDNPTIAVDPRKPAALLAAFAGQGVWRWTP